MGKPEIRGVMDACEVCKDYEKPFCYALKTIRDLGHYYRGWCGRDTEHGVLYSDHVVRQALIEGDNVIYAKSVDLPPEER